MKKILGTLKQRFLNKFFWNLQIETIYPDRTMIGEYVDGSETEGLEILRGLYRITTRNSHLCRRLEVLFGYGLNNSWIGYGASSGNLYYVGRHEVEEMNEKLKICFDIDFLSDERWTRRYYVKLG